MQPLHPREIGDWYRELAAAAPDVSAVDVRMTLLRLLFMAMGQARGIIAPTWLTQVHERGDIAASLRAQCHRLGAGTVDANDIGDIASIPNIDDRQLRPLVAALDHACRQGRCAREILHPEDLGRIYEYLVACEDGGGRKARGVYYTPNEVAEYLAALALAQARPTGAEDAEPLSILDPACGGGRLLLAAARHILPDTASPSERLRLLAASIFGIDVDIGAVCATRMALLLLAFDGPNVHNRCAEEHTASASEHAHGVARNIACGNALLDREGAALLGLPEDLAIDWNKLTDCGRFDVVLGNPPWGQKDVGKDSAASAYLRRRFKSSVGIFDYFRPFVELSVERLRSRGVFAMVLPDIVLLKNYPTTRRHLLDHLALTRIDWWGKAFRAASIDTATIVGIRRDSDDPGTADDSESNTVRIHIRERTRTRVHDIPQRDFRANERHIFNLHLTPERRRILHHMHQCEQAQLGQWFEVHEGVHSGNIRRELFVDSAVDQSCRPLYFGRDEIAPYRLNWHGRYVRLSAVPKQRTRMRYANVGQHQWYERDKVLVRRTGDRVLAAVDRSGYYASNNFFIVISRRPPRPHTPLADGNGNGNDDDDSATDVNRHPIAGPNAADEANGAPRLGLDGLSALLNSTLMTWYFRTIEPRRGRAFAEIKIKHLNRFPMPAPGPDASDLSCLDALGGERREATSAEQIRNLNHRINTAVYQSFALSSDDVGRIESDG